MSTPEVAIELRDVHKGFRMRDVGQRTLKARATELFRPGDKTKLYVLEGVSFDVHRGEFFGIIGRNGSGKSTLLKLIASVYALDAGTIRVAGHLAPFIELGVGFDTEMTAYDNVVMNATMMGLTPAEARNRFDAVIEYAELEDYTEIPLRNYSSGMRVRLSFAVMTQIKADILLVDEVLAVGDARFQQKCQATLEEMRASGMTIVLVTHSMANVRRFCERAVLIESGKVLMIGEGEEVASSYERTLGAGPGRAHVGAVAR